MDWVYGIASNFILYASPVNPGNETPEQLALFPQFRAIEELLNDSFDSGIGMAVTYDTTLESGADLAIVVSQGREAAADRLQSAFGIICEDILVSFRYNLFGTGLRRYFNTYLEAEYERGYYSGPVGPFENCSDSGIACGQHWMFQTFCPKTCGCSDPSGHALFELATQPKQGCPAECIGSTAWLGAVQELSCKDYNTSEQARLWERWAAKWAVGFAAGIDAFPLNYNLYSSEYWCKEITFHSGQRSLSCHDFFLWYGCGVIDLWTAWFGGDPCQGIWFKDLWEGLPLAPVCQESCCPKMSVQDQEVHCGSHCGWLNP